MALRRGGWVARRETAKRLTRRIKAAGRSLAKKLNGPINLRAGRDFSEKIRRTKRRRAILRLAAVSYRAI